MEYENKRNLLADVREGRELRLTDKINLILTLSLPSIMAQLMSIVMQYIDAAMVGKLGATKSAAIGLVASSTWLIGSICGSTVHGYSIQVAQYLGARDNKRARAVLKHSYPVVLGITTFVAIIGALLHQIVPVIMGGEKEILFDASMYFLIYCIALPIMVLRRLSSAILSCSGNMKITGILNSLMCVLDVVFNLIFIFGLGLGVSGAAIGTAMAELVTTALLMYFLLRKTPSLMKAPGEHIGFESTYVKKAFKLSLPITFENVVVCGAMVANTRCAAPLGVASIAAHSFAITAESLCYMPGYGIEDAATTIVGQSVGAGRKELAYSFGRLTTFLGMGVMAVMGVLMYFMAPFLMGLLTPDSEVIALGTRVLRIEAFAEPMYGASIVITGVLRGAGDTFVPSVFNLVSLWGVRVPLSFLLVGAMGLGGIWLAMCIELIFRGTIFLIRLLRKRWIKSIV